MDDKVKILFIKSKKELKNIFYNLPLSLIIGLSLLINIFLLFYLIWRYALISDFTIIHYSVLSGVDWVDQKIKLFVYPFSSLTILLINFILIFYLYRYQEKIICFFLAISSLIISIIFNVSFFLVMTL